MKTIALSLLLSIAVPVHGQQAVNERVRDLAAQIATSVQKAEKRRIAVLPLRELGGQPTALGAYLAENLVTHLVQLGDFRIVDRESLDRISGELRAQRSETLDPTTAKKIGRITAVDVIVTGTMTELENLIAINCRLTDATTGEVFGAAQTTITKDADVVKILNVAIPTDGQATGAVPTRGATSDLGTLRVILKSVVPATRARGGGRTMNGLRWIVELQNREARKTMVVAVNAEGREPRGRGLRIVSHSSGDVTPLRATVLDAQGGVWRLSANGLNGIGYVRAGVHGRNGSESYSPTDIVRLLRRRDELGRDTDDPADGRVTRATSTGEGGSNVTFGGGRVTSPQRFVPFNGNQFISGTTVEIGPGKTLIVTMDFYPDDPLARPVAAPNALQLNCEVVVGIGDTGARTYALHTLAFEGVRLAMP